MDTINYINVNGTTYEISGNIDTSTLMQIAITLPSIPNVTTLSYNDTQFSVGDIVRVADSNSDTGYTFYRLHKISDNKAYWTKLDTGTVIDDAVITVTMNHNQTGTFTSGSATISYTYNSESITDTLTGNQVQFLVPAGISYTISFSTVNGYATPSNITGTTAAFGRPTHTVSYNTEIVTVSTSMSGATLYIDNVEYTQPVNIPYGTTYTVSGSTIQGYKTTAQTFTAEQASRTVTVVYTEAVSGIFAITANGEEVSYNDADSNCVGVVVRDAENDSKLYNKDQSYLTSITLSEAFAAYANGETGIVNTNNIVNDPLCASETAANNAAKYCRSIANPVTGEYDGYLGSLAEWVVVNNNLTAINQIMGVIGSTGALSMYRSGYTSGHYSYTYYWTSSESSDTNAYLFGLHSNQTNTYQQESIFSVYSKKSNTQQFCVQTFFPLN